MPKKHIYLFTSKTLPKLSEVGGKAQSLIIMTQQNFSVPSGFVLSVSFFEPWMKKIYATPAWKRFLKSSFSQLKKHCDAVKKSCKNLKFSPKQKMEMQNAMKKLSKHSVFAVRSSSPEEDLEGTSFAGGYETTLGVTAKTLENAVLDSFISVFDERIVKYKKQNKMPTDNPRIAVIVQAQIASDVSGVAFSLNPQNNCFDEAVINSNFGLGETVVAGQITPDTFIVDKVKKKILEKKIGNKTHALWLTKSGGTKEKENLKPFDASLTDTQAKQIAKLVFNVEKYYEKPMDIEWAIHNKKLYLLQARPITAYLPLPEVLVTKPGKQKHLYVNMGLVKQGFHGLMSPMGSDMFFYMMTMLGDLFSDAMLEGPEEGIGILDSGVMLTQVGNMQKMMGKKTTALSIDIGGQTVVDTYKSIDMKEYVPKKLPKSLVKARRQMFRFIFKQLGPVIKASRDPLTYLKQYKKDDAHQEKEHRKLFHKQFDTLESAILDAMEVNFRSMMDQVSAIIGVARFAKMSIERMFKKDDVQDLLVSLEMALPGNKTSEMGQMMYEIASQPEIIKSKSYTEFSKKLKERTFSKKFFKIWDHYMEKHGFRGMGELDISTPRTYENLSEFYQKLKDMGEQVRKGKESVFEIAQKKREAAFKELCKIASKKGPRKLKKLKKKYKIFLALAGLRENPKYTLIRMIDFIRQKALGFADQFVKEKRIDKREDVFNLRVKDIDMALKDKKYDLRTRIEKNTAYSRKLHGKDIPVFFDSRGKIFRPPVKRVEQGSLLGEPISPGVVTGRVKVCHSAHEKPILPGEILVAKATDPGWTPLFINAGAVVLENGGSLQHGAVVAREYGKPCVSDIVDATNILKDGQLVEVDGSNGIIRIINLDNPYMGQKAQWVPDDPKAVLARASIVELMPDPLTPFFGEIAKPYVVKGLENLMDKLMKKNIMKDWDFKFPVLNGYGYYQMKFSLWSYIKVTFKVFPLMSWLLNQCIIDWKEKARPKFLGLIENWKQQKISKMSCQKLLEGGTLLTAETMKYYPNVQGILPVIYMGEATFMGYYNKLVRRKDEPPFETFVMGYDSTPILADKSLYDISMWIKKQKALASLFLKMSHSDFAKLFYGKTVPKGVTQSVWKEWKKRFQKHLDTYGHMIYDLDIAKAVPADNPEPLFGTMKYYLSGDGVNPYKRQEETVKKREAATEKMLKRLGFIRRYFFRKILRFAQKRVPYREDGLADIGIAYPLARKMLLELGDRLRKNGVIENKEDVFFIKPNEMKRICKRLDTKKKVESMQDIVVDRKNLWDWQRTLTPPPLIAQGWFMKKMFNWYFPESSGEKKVETLKGLGASKGIITGTARVILEPKDFDKMKPGDILVTAITTPAWTPLFALASGVVTDVGGVLSHSSIVAREYGIPAVLGTGVATKQIQNGQIITVDGDSGVVTLQ